MSTPPRVIYRCRRLSPEFRIPSASIADLPPKTGVLTPPRPHRVVCRMVLAIGQELPIWGDIDCPNYFEAAPNRTFERPWENNQGQPFSCSGCPLYPAVWAIWPSWIGDARGQRFGGTFLVLGLDGEVDEHNTVGSALAASPGTGVHSVWCSGALIGRVRSSWDPQATC